MKFGQLFLKILNISKHEIGRVVEAWLVRLCYQTGYVISFTVLTAIIVNEFGISELPYLYIANALIMIVGSLFYSYILRRLPHKGIIVTSILLAVLTLLISIWLFADNITLFLISALFSLSFFVGQIYILLLAWIEELFSPNENQRANPIIETSEPIGGITGGIILVLFAGKIPIAHFMYFSAAFLFCIVPLMVLFLRKRYGRVRLVLPEEENHEEHHTSSLQKGFHHLKAIPFVRGLAIVIMLQWVFINMVNFEYTKAVDANVSHGTTEVSISHEKDSAESGAHPEETLHGAAPIDGYDPSPQHSESHEDALTHGLGTLHIILSLFMLLMQLFLSSRIVTKLGIVRSMQLLPGLTLVSAIGMFINFNFATAVITKAVNEVFLVVTNNSYHNAYYVISEHVREQIREFLEGIVRPFGVIIGTCLLLLYQNYIPLQWVDNAIIISIAVVVVIMLFVLHLIRGKYTQLAQKCIDTPGEHPEKFNAIEILSQNGHNEASAILSKNLLFKKETAAAKIKILKSLAILKDIDAMPEILGCLSDPNPNVQIQACRTLSSYQQLGKHFYSQAFARHRVVGKLKELFKEKTFPKLRIEMMQVFANIHHEGIVDFLVELLDTEPEETKDDLIAVIGMFNDINAAHYIEKYLDSTVPEIKAKTIIALWQFKKYRLKLLVHLMSMLDDSENINMVLHGIHVLGETKSIQELPRLLEYLKSENSDIRAYAAIALAKIGIHDSMGYILEMLLHEDREYSLSSKQLLQNIEPYYIKTLYAQLEQHIYELIRDIAGHAKKISLKELTKEKLELLKHYFILLEHEHNLMKIEHMLRKL